MLTALTLLAFLAIDDKEADDALAKFKTAFKSTDVNVRMQAVTELGQVQHEKIMKTLSTCLTTDEKGVRVVAAKALGKYETKKSLAVAILSSGVAANVSEIEVEESIFAALKQLNDPSALPTAYQYFENKHEKLAEAAIRLTGEIKSRNSIDPLIRLMKKFQNAGEAVTGGTGAYNGQAVPADPELRARALHLTGVANKALEAITQEKYGNVHEWDAWWKKNAGSFKVKS